MRIDCGGCVLRPWRAGDQQSLTAHANDRDVWLNLRDQFPHPYTQADAEHWIGFASGQARPTSLAIDVDGHAVGGVSLRLQEDVERITAEIGYWLGKAFWNRGLMTAAVRAMTDYGFEQLALTRIYAVPFAGNVASQRVLAKAGYVREGVLRRSAIKDGVVTDQVLLAITDRDRSAAAALEELVRRFQACELPRPEWTHAAHLSVGLWHVSRFGADDAMTRLRSGIRRLNESNGVVNSLSSGYHETITWAYVQLLAAFAARHSDAPVAERVARLLSGPLAERRALLTFYSRDRLESAEARRGLVEPDLGPLGLDALVV
jgi:RimJ/RimL family protein N-acetyltransferase